MRLVLFMIVSLAFFSTTAQSLEKARSFLERGENYNCKAYLANLDLDSFDKTGQALYYELLGKANNNLNLGKDAVDCLLKSRDLYRNEGLDDASADVTLELLQCLLVMEGDSKKYTTYLEEFIGYAKSSPNPIHLALAYKHMGNAWAYDKPQDGIAYYRKAVPLARRAKDSLLECNLKCNMAIVYLDGLKNKDSSLFFLTDARRYLPANQPNMACNLLINESAWYRANGDFLTALTKLREAEAINTPKWQRKTKLTIYQRMADVFDSLQDYKSALTYRNKHIALSEDLKEFGQTLEMNNTLNLLALREREAVNQRLRIVNFSIAGALLAILIISVISYKNLTKKRKLAEQQKLIETQRLENQISEQELHHLDQMMETQEKERQRIADELHDDLGGMLATLKLNISHLDQAATPQDKAWLERTEGLIDQTYQKVRSISHLKNLGVAADRGLLKSVMSMADKMSVPGKMQVNVIPFGLSDRIDNNTEVTLFRIIMELCTNVLKHAGASEINIYLNQYENQGLNILVEDNGKGFDVGRVIKTDGIGLKNIEKKIEQLRGTFTVDSTPGSGTTVIIDLPL